MFTTEPTSGPIPGDEMPAPAPAPDDVRAYPIPESADDPRFSLGLLTDVAAVLVQHGYPTLHSADLAALGKTLLKFIYEHEAYQDPPPSAAAVRLSDEDLAAAVTAGWPVIVEDLADVAAAAEAGADPAERIAAVAAVAPQYVRQAGLGPLPGDEQDTATREPDTCRDPGPGGDQAVAADTAPVVAELAAAGRRVQRWATITDAVAAGCPLPQRVEVSADGWQVALTVANETEVSTWGEWLGIASTLATQVYSPRRGLVERTTSVQRTHPWAITVSAVLAVDAIGAQAGYAVAGAR